MKAPVDIVGAGAFGTALAITLAKHGVTVALWARSNAQELAETRENRRRLPGHLLPDGVQITDRLDALTAPIRLIALPTQTIRGAASLFADAELLVSCAKGIDLASGLGPARLLAQMAPRANVAQLTGPGFAEDIARGLPTALTIAAPGEIGTDLQAQLSTPTMRLYRSTDLIGAELGGALKNVIAIASGAVMGANLGVSARAALIARGFAEMRRVAASQGGLEETMVGLSGLGDLVLTATSDMSRNYRYGQALARGEAWSDDITIEGRATAQALAARDDLDTPIADAVDHLAAGRASVADIAATLLSRPLKAE